MHYRTLTIATAAVLIGSWTSAQAQTNIGSFRVWNAYTAEAAYGKVCFIASQPQDSRYSQSVSARDPVFFMITSVPARSIQNETSTIIGYALAQDAHVTVDIDGQKFELFTDYSDAAWARPEEEAALVAAMKAGTRMTVQGKSRRGTITTDIYSLLGVTAALDKIASECS